MLILLMLLIYGCFDACLPLPACLPTCLPVLVCLPVLLLVLLPVACCLLPAAYLFCVNDVRYFLVYSQNASTLKMGTVSNSGMHEVHHRYDFSS